MPSNHDRLIAFLKDPPERISDKAVKKRKRRIGQAIGSYRGEMFKRQKGRCKYCGVPMSWDTTRTGATIDHVVPISKGGKNQRGNLVLACRGCNNAKADASAEEFKAALDAGVEFPRCDSPAAALKRGWR
jgi:5-methylcytosine-specific restriction endonuclease McrA